MEYIFEFAKKKFLLAGLIQIALKKIAFNSLHASVKEKVVSEIHILRQLNHKHIIRLYDYKFEGDSQWLIVALKLTGN